VELHEWNVDDELSRGLWMVEVTKDLKTFACPSCTELDGEVRRSPRSPSPWPDPSPAPRAIARGAALRGRIPSLPSRPRPQWDKLSALLNELYAKHTAELASGEAEGDAPPEIRLGRINVGACPSLGDRFGVRTFPAVFLVNDGEARKYGGTKETLAMASHAASVASWTGGSTARVSPPLAPLPAHLAPVAAAAGLVRRLLTEEFYSTYSAFHVSGSRTLDSLLCLGLVLVPLTAGLVFLVRFEQGVRHADRRMREAEEAERRERARKGKKEVLQGSPGFSKWSRGRGGVAFVENKKTR